MESRGLGMFPNKLPVTMGLSDSKRSSWASITPPSTSSTIPTLDIKFAVEWQELMRQYSKCAFTYRGDKLIALEVSSKATYRFGQVINTLLGCGKVQHCLVSLGGGGTRTASYFLSKKPPSALLVGHGPLLTGKYASHSTFLSPYRDPMSAMLRSKT